VLVDLLSLRSAVDGVFGWCRTPLDGPGCSGSRHSNDIVGRHHESRGFGGEQLSVHSKLTITSEKSGISRTTSALLGPQQWVAWQDNPNGEHLTEPYSYPVEVGSTWETMTSFNDGTGAGRRYACSRDGGTTWSQRLISQTVDDCCDTSGFFRSAAGASSKAYITAVGPNGPRWYWSAEPCPATGSAAWTSFEPSFSGALTPPDYVFGIYDEFNDTVWATWTSEDVTSGDITVFAGVLNGFSVNYGGVYCRDSGTSWNAFSNGVFDASGHLHLVFLDEISGELRYIRAAGQPNALGPTFDCSTLRTIGPHNGSGSNCASQPGNSTIPGVGNGCLRDTFNASIAVDRTDSNTIMIVTHSANDPSCPGLPEGLVYGSDDGGNSWGMWAYFPCNVAVQPRIAAVYTPTLPAQAGRFHMMFSYSPPGSGNLEQVDLLTPDGGFTFPATVMTPQRSVQPVSGIYWGDYVGVTADLGRNQMFYTWGELNPATGLWRIRGITNDP
jgi:hypothetical protein